MPLLIRRNGVGEDLYRKRGDRTIEAGGPEPAVQRGEEQGRRLSGRPGHGQHDSGGDAGGCRAQDNPQGCAPAGHTQGEGCLAKGVGNQLQQFLRRPGDGGQHQDGQGQATGQRGEPFHRHDQQGVDEHAHDDRGDAGKDIGAESHDACGPGVPVFGQIDPGGDSQRDADARGEPHQDKGSHNGVGHPATRLADRSGKLGQQVPGESARSAHDHELQQAQKRDQRQQRGDETERSHGEVGSLPPARQGDAAIRWADAIGRVRPRVHRGFPCAATRPTRQTRSRASEFSTKVTPKSRSPISARAERWRFPVASVYSLAMTLAMV